MRPAFGDWRSLVAHFVRDEGVGGSNPLSPTKFEKPAQRAGFFASAPERMRTSGGREVRPERSERTLRQQRPAGRATQWRVISGTDQIRKACSTSRLFCIWGFVALASKAPPGGKMRLWWSFRSPDVLCFSIATEPVNVPGWLTATTLATRAPGKENRRWRAIIRPIPGAHPCGASASAIQNCSRQFCRLMPSDFRVRDQPASLQAIPSARFPAGGPGQPSTPH